MEELLQWFCCEVTFLAGGTIYYRQMSFQKYVLLTSSTVIKIHILLSWIFFGLKKKWSFLGRRSIVIALASNGSPSIENHETYKKGKYLYEKLWISITRLRKYCFKTIEKCWRKKEKQIICQENSTFSSLGSSFSCFTIKHLCPEEDNIILF